MKIKELPKSQRPYEKMELYGPKVLSEAELLAIILKSRTKDETAIDLAQSILNKNMEINKGLEFLNDLSLYELQSIKGIGKVKAIQLKALGELLFRKSNVKDLSQIKISCSNDIAQILIDKIQYETNEVIIAVILNTKNYINQIRVLSTGNEKNVSISKRDILEFCIRNNCRKLIIAHNHPSGDCTPSHDDIIFTKDLANLLREFNIKLLDHIIIGKDNFFSVGTNL